MICESLDFTWLLFIFNKKQTNSLSLFNLHSTDSLFFTHLSNAADVAILTPQPPPHRLFTDNCVVCSACANVRACHVFYANCLYSCKRACNILFYFTHILIDIISYDIYLVSSIIHMIQLYEKLKQLALLSVNLTTCDATKSHSSSNYESK